MNKRSDAYKQSDNVNKADFSSYSYYYCYSCTLPVVELLEGAVDLPLDVPRLLRSPRLASLAKAKSSAKGVGVGEEIAEIRVRRSKETPEKILSVRSGKGVSDLFIFL